MGSRLGCPDVARPLVATFHASSDGNLAYGLLRPLLGRALARLEVRTAMSKQHFTSSLAISPVTIL